MKVSLLKISRNKEVVNRLELSAIADMIRKNPEEKKVYKLRLKYQFYKPLSTFASRYAYFDAKRATPAVLGKAMNNFRFSFHHRMVNGCSEYWLCKK